jgi:signal peptidase I
MKNMSKLEPILLFVVLLFNIFLLFYIFNIGNISGFSVFGEKKTYSPYNFIKDEQITLEEDRVIIEVNDPVFSRYTNSKSMSPMLNEESTGIGFKPNSEIDIHLGDIVSFRQDGNLIVHRVVEISEDDFGKYFITRGDNNNLNDEKIRFSDIESVLIGVIY